MNVISINKRLENCRRRRPTVLLIRLWFILFSLSVLGVGNKLSFLSGIRLVHFIHFYEILLLPTLISVVGILFSKKLVTLTYYLVWMVLSGIHGFAVGGFTSMIYHDLSIHGVLLVIPLLFRYKVSTKDLHKLLIPVLILAYIGNVISITNRQLFDGDLYLRDILGFSFLGAAYAAALFRVKRKFSLLYLPAILIPLTYAFFFSARAKLICMTVALAIPYIVRARFHFSRSIIGFALGGCMFGLVFLFAPTDEAFSAKAIATGGMKFDALVHSANSRTAEFVAITDEMAGLQYVYGKGLGSSWDGYWYGDQENDSDVRYTFHIYYFEVFYKTGAIGLILFFLVFVKPLIIGVQAFSKFDALGQASVCVLGSMLAGFFSSASSTGNEAFLMAISVFCIISRKWSLGRNDQYLNGLKSKNVNKPLK